MEKWEENRERIDALEGRIKALETLCKKQAIMLQATAEGIRHRDPARPFLPAMNLRDGMNLLNEIIAEAEALEE